MSGVLLKRLPNIITGQKAILDYIINSIIDALKTALIKRI